MSIKRGPDGMPIDTPSIKPRDELPTQRTESKPASVNIDVDLGDQPTVATSGHKPARPSNKSAGLFLDDEPPTAPAKGTPSSSQAPQSSNPPPVTDDPPTVVGRARPSIPVPTSQAVEDTTDTADAMLDPVAGWLVIILGPGQGNHLKLGYGQNSIGRSTSERVTVDFGDSQISRNNHATVTYDPRGNQFYIQPGSGTNLTYINDEPTPVLQPMVLTPNSHIKVGETTLRFIPLCCDDFTWEKLEEK